MFLLHFFGMQLEFVYVYVIYCTLFSFYSFLRTKTHWGDILFAFVGKLWSGIKISSVLCGSRTHTVLYVGIETYWHPLKQMHFMNDQCKCRPDVYNSFLEY